MCVLSIVTNNVLFLPGIEASRLYRPDGNGTNKLWEPDASADVPQLFLDANGSSAKSDIYTKDVVEELPVTGNNIYKIVPRGPRHLEKYRQHHRGLQSRSV